jgi:sigma-B regulation protein RsbU (phosphoserine phosphatase)
MSSPATRAPPTGVTAPGSRPRVSSWSYAAEARRQADAFLLEQGFDLAGFDEPEARTQQLQARTDTTLRYRDREGLLGEERPYGLEVSFAGDQLTGFNSFFDEPDRNAIQDGFQPFLLLQQAWIFVVLLLLPLVAVPFVRRYHAGEIGVRRGLHVAAVVVAGGLLTMSFAGRAASAGFQFGVLTRPQTTGVVVFQLLVLFVFPMAVMTFLSWSVGESICRERHGDRLAAFDALFKGDWLNATFARAALIGTSAGLAVAALFKLLPYLLQGQGVRTYTIFMTGPWWENVGWFSIPLVAFGVAYALYFGVFGQLLLVSLGTHLAGRWLGPALAVTGGALLFFPFITIFPIAWSIPFWLLCPAIFVVLFLRYGILTSTLAYLTGWVVSGALPFLHAEDPSMQLQAALALLLVALPLIVSARYLASDRKFLYRYEDIPPHVRRIAERERQKVELETARRIQTSILPQLPPQLLGIKLSHTYLPATEVGGDFYDVLALEDGRLAVAVGDVAGHGVSSGLVMSMAKSALAVQVSFDPEVEAVFGTLNRMVYQSARKRLLTTLCYALIDPRRREMTFASAGHLFPYRISGGSTVEALESISYPLGVRDRLAVRERGARLEAGDLLFMFSDGVVEARPENSDEEFGFERLESSLAAHAGAGVDGLLDGVLADLERFTGGAPREDDLTVLVLEIP